MAERQTVSECRIPRAIAVIAALGGWVAPACTVGGDDEGLVTTQVIGGRQEAGYPSAVKVGRQLDDGMWVTCTGVVIAHDVVATAAHCVDQPDDHYAAVVGVGEESRIIDAIFSVIDPAPETDLALIVFDVDVGVAPAIIDEPSAGCGKRAVGYGNRGDAPGAAEEGERKSTAQCVQDVDHAWIDTVGEGGGLCPGDSGGPLYVDGTDRVLGVLSGTQPTPRWQFWKRHGCIEENETRHTSLSHEIAFIREWACVAGGSKAACSRTPVCGDGVCAADESCGSCSSDCGACECVIDADCGPDAVCQQGACQTLACHDDSCPPGYLCDAGGLCVECLPGTVQSCGACCTQLCEDGEWGRARHIC